MGKLEDRMSVHLKARQEKGNYRQLISEKLKVDFLSNDYLGLTSSETLAESVRDKKGTLGFFPAGAAGSRLLSGNSALAEQTEEYLAGLFKSESALLFNSGYTANLGLLSALPQKNDTILYDELSHSSIKEGLRLNLARRFSFRHNDLEDLEKKLQKARGVIFVLVESIYSMDGDMAPLREIAQLCARYEARLIVDEAHSTALFGEQAEGLCGALGLEDQVFARVFTFGKALGFHGACVAGSRLLTDYLVNFSRPFIYTTAQPAENLLYIRSAFEFLQLNPALKERLFANITLFRQLFDELLSEVCTKVESKSPVQAIIIPGNERVKAITSRLRAEGFDVRPILSPTVKEGEERIRICIHAFNTPLEIKQLLVLLRQVVEDTVKERRQEIR